MDASEIEFQVRKIRLVIPFFPFLNIEFGMLKDKKKNMRKEGM